MIQPSNHDPANNPHTLIKPYKGRGLFITATGTDVGKTAVTAALAAAFHSLHVRVSICKPIASGCPKIAERGNDPAIPLANEDFHSPDAELAAYAAGLDPHDETLMRSLSPLRYAAPASPALAAQIEDRPPDWRRVAAAFDFWQENADLLLVEGAGGWYVPLEGPPRDYMIADLAEALGLPVLVVTTAELGTINQTLLTVRAIRERNLPVVGLIFNRVPPDTDGRWGVTTDSNIHELRRLTGVPVRGLLPKLEKPLLPPPAAFPDELVHPLRPFAEEWWNMPQTSR